MFSKRGEEVEPHFHGLGDGLTTRLWDPEKLTPQLWALDPYL